MKLFYQMSLVFEIHFIGTTSIPVNLPEVLHVDKLLCFSGP